MSARHRVDTITAAPARTVVTPERVPAKSAQRRLDGWKNTLTGLGEWARDKREASHFCADLFNQTELEEIYRGHDLAARIVDAPPDDAVRAGFKVQIAGDKDLATEVMAQLGESGDDAEQPDDELPVLGHVHQALKWRRAYGGAGIILGVDDGQSPDMPLDETRIVSFEWMTVMSPYELQPVAWYSDPMSPKYGRPRLYRVTPLVISPGMVIVQPEAREEIPSGLSYVHETRVAPFQGVIVSRRQSIAQWNYGWGDSVIGRVWRVLKDFDLGWDSAANLMSDFAQAVLKTPGLFELIASQDPNDEQTVVNRAQMLDVTRSVARMMLIDKDEEFDRKPTPLTGYPDLLDRFCNRLAAAAKMPVTRMMGQAPAGLNATADADMEMWWEQVDFERQRELKPALKRIVRLKMLAKNSPTKGALPEQWAVQMPPLRLLSAKDQADVRLKTAQSDEIEIRNQVVTPEEVAQSRHGGEEWSADTTLDAELRTAMAGPSDPGDLADIPGVDPKAALQGPQMAAMLEIVRAVAGGEIPRDAGVAMLAAGFPIDPDTAEQIMGSAGQGFAPKASLPAAGPAGSAGTESATAAKPATPPAKNGPVEVQPHERAGAPVEGHTRAVPTPPEQTKADAAPKRRRK